MLQKTLFINGVRFLDLEGDTNIPTVVLYRKDGTVAIGREAQVEAETHGIELLNEDFKLDLGRYAPRVQSKRKYRTAAGTEKTAAQIADDFLYTLQKHIRDWLRRNGITECKHVAIAEPLSIHTESISQEWLKNYRDTLKRLIEGKRVLSEQGIKLRFLPEPFAVFLYYKYGLRHPLLVGAGKMYVLVIDFGGGTCDVCLIETTKEGDISHSGANSKPLVGKSIPIGGFYINRIIAADLCRKVLPQQQHSTLKTALKLYSEWYSGKVQLETLDLKYKNFIRHFHELVHRVEPWKIELVKGITDWSLDAPVHFSVSVATPRNPFEQETIMSDVSFTAEEFRVLFLDQIYKPHLKPLIGERLKLAATEIAGCDVSIVLLSGGSANIRWFERLVRQDFADLLSQAQVITLDDYRHVVAHGLAIECARELLTGDSEFRGVTYNPLYLLLQPDDGQCVPLQFEARTKGLPDVTGRPGLILPTASILQSFVNLRMEWKVRLKKAPRKKLSYWFLESSLDRTKVEKQLNVEETTVYTPKNSAFDGAILVQLTVHEDGTAIPRFVYSGGHEKREESAKEGRPFFVDMTDAACLGGEAYVGIDFGTSNTAVSYIDRTMVDVIEQRERMPSWKRINDLVDCIPYPASVPLARYLAEAEQEARVGHQARFIEAALCLLSYSAYCEFCACKDDRGSKHFKNFTQRSPSPCLHLMRQIAESCRNSGPVCETVSRILSAHGRLLDEASRQLAEERHGMSVEKRDAIETALDVLANACSDIFGRLKFGYFENVERKALSRIYRGRFRVAHGKPVFTEFFLYEGEEAFFQGEAALVDVAKGTIYRLTPLVVWFRCDTHGSSDGGHCWVYDKVWEKAGELCVRYMAANFGCSWVLSEREAEGVELVAAVRKLRENDVKLYEPASGQFFVASGAGG
ncbi:MAG: hypothetical protein WHT08_13785 [Bryobacteraceae bacterium]